MNPPEGESRSLSPDITARLEQALRAFISAPSERVTETLRTALQAAARDARARDLRPEELIVLFRAMEERIGKLPEGEFAPTSTFRSRMLGAMLQAYYDR